MESIMELLQQGKTAELIASLEEKPENIYFKDSKGVSLFLLSFYYGNKVLSQYLTERIAHPDLYESAASGNLPALESSIQTEPQRVNSYSVDGFTPLGLASYFGRKELVRWLLEHGANPNIASSNSLKVAPLHSATSSRNLEIAKLLLDAGADANQGQQNSITPLHGAAHNGDIGMVKELISRGADVNLRSDDGKSAIDYAIESGKEDVISFLKASVEDIAHEAST